jgi:hypothetical protein
MKKLFVLMGLLLLASQAHALPINSPVPANAYIVFGGLDWAWGNPCSFQGGCGDATLSYQGTQGWSIASDADLATIPADFATLFVFPGANVPLDGTDPLSGAFAYSAPGDMACAAPYFSTAWSSCDYGDGMLGQWAHPGDGAGDPGFYEQLFVRSAVPTPEPASIAILGGSLICLGVLRRRSKV